MQYYLVKVKGNDMLFTYDEINHNRLTLAVNRYTMFCQFVWIDLVDVVLFVNVYHGEIW
jgi:hypothetical protein